MELLLKQIESAELIVVNKVDLASEEELRTTLAVCAALNSGAQVRTTRFGELPLTSLLPSQQEMAGDGGGSCQQAQCTDPSHDHDHGGHDAPTHNLDKEGEACDAHGCSDPSHDHSHGHGHAHGPSAEELGFRSFVYRARRPFVEDRLLRLAARWPMPNKEFLSLGDLTESTMPPKGDGDDGDDKDGDAAAAAFAGVLRSKGTAWLDGSHLAQVGWSHAGRHFKLQFEAPWWASVPEPVMHRCLPDEDLFASEHAAFDGPDGDRRQELVFIGTQLDQAAIVTALDSCLATDAELADYRLTHDADIARLASEASTPPRFLPGAPVACNMGGGEWADGHVLANYHREEDWPLERWTPYQVRLGSGQHIWAPRDTDDIIRSR